VNRKWSGISQGGGGVNRKWSGISQGGGEHFKCQDYFWKKKRLGIKNVRNTISNTFDVQTIFGKKVFLMVLLTKGDCEKVIAKAGETRGSRTALFVKQRHSLNLPKTIESDFMKVKFIALHIISLKIRPDIIWTVDCVTLSPYLPKVHIE
jgi:hypothetical protein